MNDYYRMNARTRKVVKRFTKENGLPEPSTILKPLLVALTVTHELSLICKEVDETIARIMTLNDMIKTAIDEGNLVGVMLLKERKDEEKKKLSAFERLLDREGPMGKTDETTERLIEKARGYPYEELLTSYGCLVKRSRCRCPVHDGKNQTSFEVKNNRGRCHSCGFEGDTIELVRKVEGVTFLEAVRKLA